MNDKELIKELTKHLTLAIDCLGKTEWVIDEYFDEAWELVEDSEFNCKEAEALLEGIKQ